MPKKKSEFMGMASSELLDVMSNEKYHQPQKPLPGRYTQTRCYRHKMQVQKESKF